MSAHKRMPASVWLADSQCSCGRIYYAPQHVNDMLGDRDARIEALRLALTDELDDHQPAPGPRGRCRCGADLPCSVRANIETLVDES
jgi:hypothetical protein